MKDSLKNHEYLTVLAQHKHLSTLVTFEIAKN